MHTTTELLHELGTLGTCVVRGGQFDVDEGQARMLLGLLRLEDPRHYVLELVQAASLLGAGYITMHIDTTLMTMRCDGESFSAEELDDLYSAAFRERLNPRDEALRHIALALGSAQVLSPRVIEVSAHDSARTYALTMTPGAQDRFRERTHRGDVEGVSVRIQQRPQLRHLNVFWQRVAGRQYEVELLRDRCRFADYTLLVNQELISKPLALERASAMEVSWSDAQSRGVLGVSLDDVESRVYWLRHGVLVKVQRMWHEGFSVEAVIEHNALKLDLAMGDVVPDAAWAWAQRDVLMDQTHRAVRRILEPLIQDSTVVLGRKYSKDFMYMFPWVVSLKALRLKQIAFSVCRQCGELGRTSEVLPPHTRALLEVVEGMKIWPAADGVHDDTPWMKKLVSMSELGVGIARSTRVVHVSSARRAVRTLNEARHVLWVRSYDRDRPHEVLRSYLGVELEDVTAQIERAWVRQKNFKAWRDGGVVAPLDVRRFPIRITRELDVGSVELGMNDGGRATAECLLAPRGKLIGVVRLKEFAPAQMTLIWRGDLQVTDLYDDAERDEAFWVFALRSIQMAGEALIAWSGELTPPVSSGEQRAVRSALCMWCEGREGESLLGGLGMWSRTLMARYEAWRKGRQGRLFWLARYASLAQRTDADLMQIIQTLGPLAGVPLCEDLCGQERTLDEVLKSALTHGRLAVVEQDRLDESRRHFRYAGVEREVVVLDEQLGVILRALCGPGRLEAFDGELARLAGMKRFMSMREQRPELTRSAVVKVQIAGEGVTGEIGLMEGHVDVPGRCELRVLYLGRQVSDVMYPVPCGRMIAVIDGEHLRPLPSWQGVQDDDALKACMQSVSHSVQALYAAYVQQMQRVHVTVDHDVAWCRMMCRLARIARQDSKMHRLANALPIWRVGSGERLALSAWRARIEGDEALVYATAKSLVSDLWKSSQDVDKDKVLVLPSGLAQPASWVLELVDGHHRLLSFEEFTQGGVRLSEARAAFLERPQREVELERRDYIATARFATPGGHGHIGFKVDDAPLQCRGELDVTYLNEHRVVLRRKVGVASVGRFDVIVEDGDLVDWELSDEVVHEAMRACERECERQAFELFVRTCEELTRGEVRASEEVRHMLAVYAWRLRDSGFERELELLSRVPLFGVDDERAVSIEELRERGEEVRCALRGQVAKEGVVVVGREAQRRAMRGAIFPVSVVDVAYESSQENRPPHRAARSEQDVTSELPRLAVRIVACIEEVCGERAYLRDPARMRGVEIVEMESGVADVLARQDGILLNASSPALTAWLDRPDDIYFAALVSAVYSAMNLEEEDVTDHHEQEFLARLQAWRVHHS